MRDRINAGEEIGARLGDTMQLLADTSLRDVFSLFYVLPTFFNSDLDRGFSIIDYDLNEELVSACDLGAASVLGLDFKFDLVLNHMSVASMECLSLAFRPEPLIVFSGPASAVEDALLVAMTFSIG